jgi:hypothetical protein
MATEIEEQRKRIRALEVAVAERSRAETVRRATADENSMRKKNRDRDGL